MRSRAIRLVLPFAAVFLAACPDSTTPKPAVGYQAVAGNNQTAVVGSAVVVPPTVKVIDADGNGVSGIAVTWTVISGAGSVASPAATTNAEGIATSGAWTLGPVVGNNIVRAAAAGVPTVIAFTAIATAGPPAAFTIQAGANQIAAAGDPVQVPPSVKVTDANGNGIQGIAVIFEITNGGGTLTGATATTSSLGIASVGSWKLGPASGANTISATAAGLPPLSISATATAPATQVVVNTQPAGAITGEAFTTQPVVSIRDAANAVVTTSTAAVTATIIGTGVLTGTRTVNAVAGIATFADLMVTGTDPVTLRFSVTGLTPATSNSFTPTPPPPLNLTIDNLHLTQATQTYAGTVPIVAGRAAVARVFVKANVNNTATPSVRLRTYTASGAELKTYMIPPPTTFVPKTIDESLLTWSWTVMIPANEVVEGMRVLADVDPANAIVEGSETDNTFPTSGTPLALDVRQVPTMKVTFIPITQPGLPAGNVTPANVDQWLDYAKRVFPFDTVDAIVAAPFSWNTVLSGSSYQPTWGNLLDQIRAKRIAEAPGSYDRFYYGVIRPGYGSGNTGWGSIGSPTAIGADFTGSVQPSTNWYSMTLAHEWGHNFGRRHVACGGPTGIDASYPYDPEKSIGAHGYDLSYGQLRRPTEFREFMSYCQPLWISDYTYQAVLQARQNYFGSSSNASRRSLLVWGHIGPSGVVLEPAFEIDVPLQLEPAGPYTVQALDESGRQLFAVAFAGYEVDHAPGYRTFAFAVPLPESGTVPATLRVLAGTREIARRGRARSLNPGGAATNSIGSTRLTSVSGSRARLEWNATDFPMAMVRDAVTGEVLAFVSGGTAEVNLPRTDVDVLFSNGVTSIKQRVPISR